MSYFFSKHDKGTFTNHWAMREISMLHDYQTKGRAMQEATVFTTQEPGRMEQLSLSLSLSLKALEEKLC